MASVCAFPMILQRTIFPSDPEPGASGAVIGKMNKEFLMDLIRIIIAIILPPLGVFMQVGLGKHFWINIILTLLGYIPGIVHAIWIIARVK